MADDVRCFRTRIAWYVVAPFWGFLLLLTVGAALNPNGPLAGRLVGALTAAVIGWAGWHAWRAGVEVSSSGVRVRRWLGRTTSQPWRDVDRFALVPNGKGGAYVAVVLDDGRELTTQGLVAMSVESERGRELVARLEAARPTTA